MASSQSNAWPVLPALADWKNTLDTLHRWIQIVGKVRLAASPWLNHSWHATFYVTPRGLTTGVIPHGTTTFQCDFDFINHQLVIRTHAGQTRSIPLRPQSVAAFYRQVMETLQTMGVGVAIVPWPCEMADCDRFEQDEKRSAYDASAVQQFWRALVQSDRVFHTFRARFQGKCSPVHVFWGAFDLAVTRFSGRTAPQHPGGVPNLPDWVVRDAYSHEVSSAGFWAGGPGVEAPAFYSYSYPEPEGYRAASIRPAAAFYHETLREFLLPYETVRTAADPDAMLLDFLQSTYEAAANGAQWDRAALERSESRQ